MKRLLLTASVLLAAAAAGASAQDLQLAKSGEVYKGPAHIKVEVARTAAGDKALVRVSNADLVPQMNGTFLADVVQLPDPPHTEYQVNLGKERHTLLWTNMPGRVPVALFLRPNQAKPLEPMNRQHFIALDADKAETQRLQPRSLLPVGGTALK